MNKAKLYITVNEYVTVHFKLTECVCPCCDRLKIVPGFYSHMELLERMRFKLDFPIIINSGYRCPDHNTAIGGAKRSWHMLFATDIRPAWVAGEDENAWIGKLEAMYEAALELNFGGIGRYETFMHLDLRPKKTRWRG